MKSSEHDGEALAAARKAEMIRRQIGVSWGDLLRAPEQHPQRPEPQVYDPVDLAACWCNSHKLTEWERSFIASIAMRRSLSPKQASVFARIVAKARA